MLHSILRLHHRWASPPKSSIFLLTPHTKHVLGGRGRVSLLSILAQSSSQLTISPSTIPNLSWMTLARGARQLVVQDALLKQSVCKGTVW